MLWGIYKRWCQFIKGISVGLCIQGVSASDTRAFVAVSGNFTIHSKELLMGFSWTSDRWLGFMGVSRNFTRISELRPFCGMWHFREFRSFLFLMVLLETFDNPWTYHLAEHNIIVMWAVNVGVNFPHNASWPFKINYSCRSYDQQPRTQFHELCEQKHCSWCSEE